MISLYVSYAAGRRLELVTPVTVFSRPACVMIMSDCKYCMLFLCKKKKKSGADEGPVLSTEVWLVLIIYALPPPHFKEFGGAYCACIVRYFVLVFLRGLKHFFGVKI